MNDWTIHDVGEHGAGRLLPFCGIPISVDWSAAEVQRCAEAGARGLKLHAVRERLSFLDENSAAALKRVLQASATARLPVLIHIPMESADEVRAFFAIARSIPDAQVIAAHQIAPNLPLLGEAPDNVWIEVSGLTLAPLEAANAFVSAWRQFGIERVMLGSDWPTMGLSPRAHVDHLAQYPLTESERASVIHGNGLRLFPVAEPTSD